MHVLLDGYWWAEGPPSGRRTADSFIRTWLEENPADQVTVAVPAAHLTRLREQVRAAGQPVTLRPLRLRPHGVAVIGELGRDRTVDASLTHNFTPARSRAVRGVFVHDLMFDDHPQHFSRAERAYFSLMPWSALRADVVFTSSAAEADRISRVRPALADRVQAVGLGLPRSFVDAVPEDPRLGLTAGGFLLCVGRLNVRKNVDRLIDALLPSGVLTPDRPLVVVGQPDGLALRGAPDDERVRFLGGVSDASLGWLYQQCRLFLFPSLDEGFGLPVLEAGHWGAPMALSDIPPFRELAPGAAFFDPHDVPDMARVVREALAAPAAAAPVRSWAWPEVVGAMRERLVHEVAHR